MDHFNCDFKSGEEINESLLVANGLSTLPHPIQSRYAKTRLPNNNIDNNPKIKYQYHVECGSSQRKSR